MEKNNKERVDNKSHFYKNSEKGFIKILLQLFLKIKEVE